jgi:hypothetical protein
VCCQCFHRHGEGAWRWDGDGDGQGESDADGQQQTGRHLHQLMIHMVDSEGGRSIRKKKCRERCKEWRKTELGRGEGGRSQVAAEFDVLRLAEHVWQHYSLYSCIVSSIITLNELTNEFILSTGYIKPIAIAPSSIKPPKPHMYSERKTRNHPIHRPANMYKN